MLRTSLAHGVEQPTHEGLHGDKPRPYLPWSSGIGRAGVIILALWGPSEPSATQGAGRQLWRDDEVAFHGGDSGGGGGGGPGGAGLFE